MEQIKDIFKQVRQAKGSLAFCNGGESSMTPCMHWPTGWSCYGPDSGRERQGSGSDGSVESQI